MEDYLNGTDVIRLSSASHYETGTKNEEESSWFGLLEVLAARRWLVLGIAACGTTIAAAMAFLLPDVYTATAVIMPPQQAQSAAAALLGSLGSLAGVAGRELGVKNPADLYLGLLESRTIADNVIKHFHLKSVYQTENEFDTRRKLQQNSQFTAGKDSLIHVDVEDTDPKRAAAMANEFVEELNQQNRRLATTDAGARRQFLQDQIEQEKAALTEAEEAMKNAQVRTGVLQLDAQARMTLTTIAELRAKIGSGEALLQRLRMGGTQQNPEVMSAEAELGTMRTQLRQLEVASGDRGSDPFMPTTAMPQAGLDYVRRLRDVKYHEFLFEMLSKQYEAARLDESKASPPIQTVDLALPPERKSGPPRLLMTVVGLLISTGVGCAAALIQQWMKKSGTSDRFRRLMNSRSDDALANSEI